MQLLQSAANTAAKPLDGPVACGQLWNVGPADDRQWTILDEAQATTANTRTNSRSAGASQERAVRKAEGSLIGKLQRLFDAIWDKSIAGAPDVAPVSVFACRRKLG